MLERLTALSADHFDAHPDEINWGDVGIRTRVRVTMQRVDVSIDQIVEQFMLPLPTGRIVFLSCYSGAEVGAANTLLQRRFELIEPLCRQFVNSLVLTSIY